MWCAPSGTRSYSRTAREGLSALAMRAAVRRTAEDVAVVGQAAKAAVANADFAEAFILERALDSAEGNLRSAASPDPADSESVASVASWTSEPDIT